MQPRFRLPTTSGFGFFYSVILLLISIPMVMIYSAAWGFYSHPQGFEVHTKVPKFAGPVFDNPLVVTVSNCVTCVRPKLYLNAAPITWEQLNPALRAELSRRAERVVYIEGDESLKLDDVMVVIDSTQQAWRGVPVVLLTPALKKQIHSGSELFPSERR